MFCPQLKFSDFWFVKRLFGSGISETSVEELLNDSTHSIWQLLWCLCLTIDLSAAVNNFAHTWWIIVFDLFPVVWLAHKAFGHMWEEWTTMLDCLILWLVHMFGSRIDTNVQSESFTLPHRNRLRRSGGADRMSPEEIPDSPDNKTPYYTPTHRLLTSNWTQGRPRVAKFILINDQQVFQHDHQEHERTSSSSTSLIFMAVFL